MENILKSNNINAMHMFIFVSCLVIIKYGILGFVLSKKVKSSYHKEAIESIVTFAILIGVFYLNRNSNISLSNANILMNIIYVIIAAILYYAVNVIIGEKFGQEKTKNQLQIEKSTKEVPFFMSLISTGILAPVFEEVIFRFYIQDFIFGNTIAAILISSLLFSVMHMMLGFSISGFLTYMGASIVVGILYKLSGEMLFTSIMHIIVNSLAVIFMYYEGALKDLGKEEII